MAIFGPFEQIAKQCSEYPYFKEAFEYLKSISTANSNDNKRLLALKEGAFEKIGLVDDLFGLEQVYYTKLRQECFFESHRQYIDIQFILDGKERIDVYPAELLEIDEEYNAEMDLIKYIDHKNVSSLYLRRGDVAIFFPEDAHMPCLRAEESTLVYKTVVKVPVSAA